VIGVKDGWPKPISGMNRWELAQLIAGFAADRHREIVGDCIVSDSSHFRESADRMFVQFVRFDIGELAEIAAEFLKSEGMPIDQKFLIPSKYFMHIDFSKK
jgi:hypothetical protein